MRRRDFTTFGATATAWPLVARAQQATVPVIGVIGAIYFRFIQIISALPYLTRVFGDKRDGTSFKPVKRSDM